MKILNLSLDNSVLKKDSFTAKRIIDYGNLVDKYTVVVPAKTDSQINLSDKVQVYGVGAKVKTLAVGKIYFLASKLISRDKYQVITVQDQYYLALVGWLLAKKFKIGLEIQVHGFEKFYGVRKLTAKYVIPRAQAVRTVSQRARRQLINKFGVKRDRITVVPIYVKSTNLNEFKTNINELNKDGKFIFLTIGRLVPVKNIGLQIRALVEVIKKYHNIELWIVGDGPEKGNLKLEIENLGLEGKVKIFGWQDNLEKFYSQADVFLLTSDYEGWGMVVIEAAARGLPIIMTDVGCAGEIIKGFERAVTLQSGGQANSAHANVNNEASGIIIPVNDQKKLEEAMIKLIEDRELRKKLGERARKAVLNLPNKEETLRLYQESWEKAILK